MEFLSLQEPGEAPTVRVSRSEAILLSIGLHVCLVLLFLFGPVLALRVLPGSIMALLTGRPPSTLVASLPSVAPATDASGRKRAAPEKIPLKFAYVSVPNDIATEKNPNARLLFL